MRFILNFIFFGFLFYGIFLAFPDAFFKLVEWTNAIFEFLRDFFMALWNRLQEFMGRPVDHSSAIFSLPYWLGGKG